MDVVIDSRLVETEVDLTPRLPDSVTPGEIDMDAATHATAGWLKALVSRWGMRWGRMPAPRR
jgi:hypothetical protein